LEIVASTKLQLSFGQPDFGQHPVDDLFRGLGPLTLFSAKHKWNPPRLANLRKLHDQGFGFSVRGDGPIIIAGVDGGSIADVNFPPINFILFHPNQSNIFYSQFIFSWPE
jgi:hypothetical protein